uniref:C-type lectin domain-containing protein n=1 Tax=Ornithorhynchus anatinus TaxID=9258 RepID=A0A6I8P6N5_ORNAN
EHSINTVTGKPLRVGEPGDHWDPRNWSPTKLGNVKLVHICLLALVITLLTISGDCSVLYLDNRKIQTSPRIPLAAPCPDNGNGFQGKCYYFSEDKRNWTSSQSFCTSHAAALIVIDTSWVMDLLMSDKGPCDYWTGLSREAGQDWKWTNGTKFTGWFEIKGRGECAYLNDERVSRARNYTNRRWICSKSNFYTKRRREAFPD